MGVGMALVLPESSVAAATGSLAEAGIDSWIAGVGRPREGESRLGRPCTADTPPLTPLC